MLNFIETFFNACRCDNDIGIIAMCIVASCIDIGCFHFCSHTSGWARTLYIDNQHWQFRHRCHRQGFRHQAQTRARCTCKATNTSVYATHRHHTSSNFIFCLYHCGTDFVHFLNHVFHYFRSWRNRIGCHETGTCRNRTQC